MSPYLVLELVVKSTDLLFSFFIFCLQSSSLLSFLLERLLEDFSLFALNVKSLAWIRGLVLR